MKFWLSLDTTGESYSLALWQEQCLISECSGGRSRQHLVQIFPALHLLCQQAQIKLGQVKAVAVTAGPGSFTGLRTGLLMARTLGQVGNFLLYPVSTLDALAANVVEANSLVAAVDARKGQIAFARYRVVKGFPTLLAGPALVDYADFHKHIPAGSLLLGSACHLSIIEEIADQVQVLPADLWRVRAAVLGRLAWLSLQQGLGITWTELQPEYVRAADVQVHSK